MADVSNLRANINGVFETFGVKDKIARENAENLSNALFTAQIVDSASGAIASFSDGADDIPVRSLTVDLEPIQDLHGYDYPWPAGGGKNKFQTTATTQTVNGKTFTVESDGSVKATGTATANIGNFTLGAVTLPAGTYKVNGLANGSASAGRLSIYNLTGSAVIATIYGGRDIEFTLSESSEVRISFVILSGDAETYTAYPMIRLASETDATFAPYENICPISGRTEVTVERTGKNIWNAFEPYRTGSGLYTDDAGATLLPNVDSAVTVTKDGEDLYVSTTAGWKFAVFVQAGLATGTYALSIDVDEGKWYGTSDGFDVAVLDSDYVITRKIAHAASFSAKYRATITLENEESAIAVSIGGRSGTLGTLRISAIQLEAGTIATAYEPYTAASTITVQLGDTVYHGSIDITTGKLIADRTLFTVSSISSVASQSYIKADATDGFINNYNIYPQLPPGRQPSDLCSDCLAFTNITLWPTPGYPNRFAINGAQIHINIANDLLGITDPTSETVATAKEKLNAYLAEHPVTLTIPIEPFEVSITPAQLSTIKGYNIIQSDAGSVTVDYVADPKLYIDKKIAEALSP